MRTDGIVPFMSSAFPIRDPSLVRPVSEESTWRLHRRNGRFPRRLLSPLPLVLRANLLLAQFVIPFGKSEIFQKFSVHSVLAGMSVRLGLFDAIPVIFSVLIMMRIVLGFSHIAGGKPKNYSHHNQNRK